jgi:acetolactate decarboxylase
MKKITPASRNMAYQIGTIRSLLTGVYEGDMRFDELAHYGNFGLGTFDGVNGEMVALDDHFYRIDAEGNAHTVEPQMTTPFAVVTHFKKSDQYELNQFKNLNSLQEHITTILESPNIIYALRLRGNFTDIDLRSEHPQPKGYRPLTETISQVQTTFSFEHIKGTMVGFWFPEYMKAINVPGFHFHFLDAAHQLGGHLFNMKIQHDSLEIMPLFDFGMHLIHTPLFEQANLNQSDDAITKKIEQE